MTAALALAPRTRFQERAERVQIAGEKFLADMLGENWRERTPEPHDRIAQTPVDAAWVEKRCAALEPMCDGVMKLIPRETQHLARGLMQRDSDARWRLFCECALRTPRIWLVQCCGLAMLKRNGKLRSLDSLRARSMLAACIIAWQLAEYDPDGDPDFPFVIRGIPYGGWQSLLSYWEQRSDGGEWREPSPGAVFGVHGGCGDPERGDCGYIAAWKLAGIARSHQPCAWLVEPWLRGKRYKNKYGEEECWAFHELRLRIPLAQGEVLAMGPSKAWWAARPRKEPRNQVEDLSAIVDVCELEWFPDEEVSAVFETAREQPLPTLTAQSATAPSGNTALATSGSQRADETSDSEPKGRPSNEPVAAVWLVSPIAESSSAPMSDGERTARPAEELPTILVDYSVEELATSAPPRPPTVYGSGKLTVVRAQEAGPMSPRVQRAIERFTQMARARDRGPPTPE